MLKLIHNDIPSMYTFGPLCSFYIIKKSVFMKKTKKTQILKLQGVSITIWEVSCYLPIIIFLYNLFTIENYQLFFFPTDSLYGHL